MREEGSWLQGWRGGSGDGDGYWVVGRRDRSKEL